MRHNLKLSVLGDKNWEIILRFWDSEGKQQQQQQTNLVHSWFKTIEWNRKSVSLLTGRIENLKCIAGITVQSKGQTNKQKKRTIKEREKKVKTD